MKDIKKRSIDKHDHRLKNPEEHLVLIHFALPPLDKLHKPIYTPDRHDRRAHIHDPQHSPEILRQDSSSVGTAMEHGGEETEGSEEGGLETERGGYHVCAHVALLVGHGAVHHPPGALAYEDFAHGVEADEGGGDAAGVEGGEIWDVVEDAAEDNCRSMLGYCLK